ncbi:ricin B lectin domain-containing protein [Mycena albidolilacea]|uniref:Ricin B lectin domain-containing protein n=1 Tax=Mycena albidolilacea TaxID=1033008 RepID=A0AAD6Z329_9AGAR|nr:ricin B lectin domain-containing protein [Mycena albidolilacea]
MPIFQGTYTITNLKSQTRCDLDGGNSANGTKVQGWGPLSPDVPEYPNQVWKVLYTNKPGVDSYTISNVRTGTYIEISGGNATDGTAVTCSAASAGAQTTDEQEWEFVKVDNSGYYKVRNVKSQTYLDIDAGSSANATKLQGWWGLLDGNENQLWAFNPVTIGAA